MLTLLLSAGHGRWRRALLRLGLVCTSLAVGLVIAEFLVRVLLPPQASLYVPDLVLNHVHTPNTVYVERQPLDEFPPNLVRFNSLGLRENREIPLKKPKGEFRVLLLGDSYIEARQVRYKETLAQVLESRLREASPGAGLSRYVVINAGVSSYCPSLEYLYLRERGLQLAPDLVLLYFTFNDVTDDFKIEQTLKRDEAGVPIAAPPHRALAGSAPRGNPGLLRGSRLLKILSLQLQAWRFRRTMGPPDPERARGIYAPFWFRNSTTIHENPLAVFRSKYGDEERQAWDITAGHIHRIAELLKERSIPMALIAIPMPAQVSANQWRVGKVKWGLKQDAVVQSVAMQDILRSLAKRDGIPFLDLLPPFRKAAEQKLFWDYDGHWTVEGNLLAAESTLAFLRESRLLPESEAQAAGKGGSR